MPSRSPERLVDAAPDDDGCGGVPSAPPPVRSRGTRASAWPGAARRASLAALLLGVGGQLSGAGIDTTRAERFDVPITAVFHADASCLTTVDGRTRIGRTLIGADVDSSGSRTLIHCDTEDGERLTLLARGDRLRRDTRVALLSHADIESGESGVIAWLTLVDSAPEDTDAPRRYVARGHVLIREVPTVLVDGAAPHSDRQPFARLDGELETLLMRPDDEEPRPSD